jgi:hypothetical protein
MPPSGHLLTILPQYRLLKSLSSNGVTLGAMKADALTQSIIVKRKTTRSTPNAKPTSDR